MTFNGKALAMVCAQFWAAAPAFAFSVGDSWDWQLTEPVDLDRNVRVLDLHPDLVTPDDLAALRQKGIRTICYVSIGTLENTSEDFIAFPDDVLGKTYEDWPDERFLDIRRLDVLLPIMKSRFEACKNEGFDAIEPDNMDVHDNDSGFPITADDVVAYVARLAAIAHSLDLGIGQKNVPDLTADLINHMDFLIAESCFQDKWCDDVNAYVRAGKPIFDAEYTDRSIDFQEACEFAAQQNIAMILKNRDLTSPVQTCP
ncbi:endo alpha-1,4 polygalactosaminidase [Roseibium aggregatum]|uniref:endo alpha-1,4 polygalactosaminidase n=1 Tax=Roseibium aggregatum TaxID=187304 RepID=UPI001A8C46C8|nr:endo alpha-1,4 polygalactosaminidase [Roseibium aggregatum]MBN8182925.1 endo alpha-1,4 polygalactosaminidase [Roseibium aggregatum]